MLLEPLRHEGMHVMKMIYLAGAFAILQLFGMYDVCGKDIVWVGFFQEGDTMSEADPEKLLHDDMILFDESQEMFGIGDDENNLCDQDSHQGVETFFEHENIRRNIRFFTKAILFIGVAALVVGVFFWCCQQSSKCQQVNKCRQVNKKPNNNPYAENTHCSSQPSCGQGEYNEHGNGGDAHQAAINDNVMLLDYNSKSLGEIKGDCFDEYLFNAVVEQFEDIRLDDAALGAIL